MSYILSLTDIADIILETLFRPKMLSMHSKHTKKTSSAINNPRFRKSMSGNTIRIDYGAVDCYYLITVSKEKEKEQNE